MNFLSCKVREYCRVFRSGHIGEGNEIGKPSLRGAGNGIVQPSLRGEGVKLLDREGEE